MTHQLVMQVAVPLVAKLVCTVEAFPVRHLSLALLRKAETLLGLAGWTNLATGCCLLYANYKTMPQVGISSLHFPNQCQLKQRYAWA